MRQPVTNAALSLLLLLLDGSPFANKKRLGLSPFISPRQKLTGLLPRPADQHKCRQLVPAGNPKHTLLQSAQMVW